MALTPLTTRITRAISKRQQRHAWHRQRISQRLLTTYDVDDAGVLTWRMLFGSASAPRVALCRAITPSRVNIISTMRVGITSFIARNERIATDALDILPHNAQRIAGAPYRAAHAVMA